MRAVKLRCHLRRVGTVKDTIHTTEPDTAYLRGRQLLEKRKYTQALYVLHDYRDRNTAIALLSLGQDREALRILEALPATAISEYLRAIACSRLGRKAEDGDTSSKPVAAMSTWSIVRRSTPKSMNS